jgi:hypothetical protein
MACDEMIAVRVTGSARRYAECLVSIAALKRPPERAVPLLAVVSGIRLHQRVARIVAPCAGVVRPWRALAISGAVGIVACALAVGNVQVVRPAVASAVVITARPATAGAAGMAVLITRASLEPTASVSGAAPARNPVSRARAMPAARKTDASQQDGGKAYSSEELSTAPIVSSSPARSELPSTPLFVPVARPPEPLTDTPGVAQTAAADPSDDASMGWTRAADAGVSIGRASQAAGVATAGFFRRFGKRVAGSF